MNTVINLGNAETPPDIIVGDIYTNGIKFYIIANVGLDDNKKSLFAAINICYGTRWQEATTVIENTILGNEVSGPLSFVKRNAKITIE